MEPIRKCRVCGLRVYVEANLSGFVRSKSGVYGYQNICKKCHREDIKQRVNRTDEFVKIFRARSHSKTVTCYFCGKEVTKLRGRNHDSLVIHSLDGNHDNWNPINKEPAHKNCHNSYHTIGKKNPNWKGDEASNSAKRKRVRTDDM